ncbi:ABC transporter substrate-binding protein [Halarchaeum nitratireducens]|uniref:Solute-binding protein family 5 domain-containing protein n=1 Tax=Halarchaeum nitratireducens TaxID=489913 RepID=A0A830G8Y6_9EURY|nr:ABC transporter substrate-binding protein [Halarchaeum nitratireducens]GGN09321.1 hypothetical protein GCM10009021_06040 [Halarchaeum nitratireducens]
MTDDSPDSDGIDRRTYLGALGAAGAAGLAGCSGGGGGGSSGEDLGERVPALTVASLGGVAGASAIEQANQHVATQISEVLGVPAEVTIKELTTLWNEAYSDSRTFSFHLDLSPQFPSNLDPDNLLYSYHIKNAGANGNPNVINYADCDFSQKLDEQRTASSTEKRREYVTDALSTASEDVMPTTLCTNTGSSIYRNDQLNAQDVGQAGPVDRNPEFLWNTEPINGANAMKSNVTPGNIPSVVYMNNRPSTPWVGTVYMPLLYRDRNYELAAGAAKDWTVENSYQTFTFDIREGMTFHDGSLLTAEDAKWTLDFLNDNADTFAVISEYPYESVTAVDDTTLTVEMSRPAPSWLTAFVPIWSGVLPKDVWRAAGAEEDPMNVEFDRIIGSGPYQVRDFQTRQILAMEPYEDHYIDVTGDLIFRGYSDRQSARRALESGSLNILLNSTNDTNEQIKNALGDKATVVTSDTFVSYELRAQHSFAPSMFREFRLAVSQTLNRTRLNAYFNGGTGTPELRSSFAGKNHPWRPESDDALTKIADSPQPNTEAAKQVLRDAGWGWDGDGRLHYPPEKDLTPRWPEGSTPCEEPDSFPCVPDICG